MIFRGKRRRVVDSQQASQGSIIFLNGTPSSGKSTLAGVLQDTLAEPHYHRSLDHFRQGYPDRCWREDDGTLFRRVLHAYLLSLHTLVSLGHHVIAEAVITPDRLDHYLALFADFPVLFVGVRCPLPEAQRREDSRPDRLLGPIDLATEGFDLVHAHGCYDLEIDTSRCAPTEAARRIKAALATPPTPTAFQRLWSARHPAPHNR